MYIDLLTQIKNAKNADKDFIKFPYSKMDRSVADLLEKKGFLKSVEVKGKGPKKIIKVYLNKDRPVKGITFISRPSLIKYSNYDDIRSVKGGHGTLVLSTSKGILSGDRARKEKVGGQLLFKIW